MSKYFDFSDAMLLADSQVASRKTQVRETVYRLYAGYDMAHMTPLLEGKKKDIQAEFAQAGREYNFAFITRKGKDEVLYFFNRKRSHKRWFQMPKGAKPTI